MLPDLFKSSQEDINYFFDNVDKKIAEEIFELFATCKGVIFFTGIGKSGLIATKIAATFTSTGTRALFISATDALHGDIGIVTPDDIFVCVSRSGETEELLNLVPFVRNKGAKLVAVVSKPISRLALACDLTMFLPLKKELCPLDLVPTTSTTIQLIFGDVMAVALMMRKKFTMEDYSSNHPAGQIGRRSKFKVKDLMLQEDATPVCKPEDTLGSVIEEFSNKQCGCILVVDREKKLLGIFTDGDLRRSLQRFGGAVLQTKMLEIMSGKPRWIDQDVLAWDALKLMEANQKRPITVLPVLNEEKKVVGIIKMHDLIQAGV